MPIQIPNDLPAAGILQQENIFVMTEQRATTQHIRPLEIVLLNLMPTKIATETQLSRLLGNTPLQVHLELMHTTSHKSKNVSAEHLLTFYKSFEELKDRKFDGMVITGAPVEHMAFEDVDYWQELCQIMEWSKTNVHSTFHICWALRPDCTIITVSTNMNYRRNCLVCIPIRRTISAPFCSVDLTIPSMYPIPVIPPFSGRILKQFPD